MKLISSADLIQITERTFSYVDFRLVGHARKVAYISYCVMKHAGGYSEPQLQQIFLLGLLHDIGAHKTDEIDNMLTFDSENVWEHSVYGSLFLKTFLPFIDSTGVFYHHLPYNQYSTAKEKLSEKHAAALICLADRIELCLRAETERECIKMLMQERGNKFSAYWADAFIALNNSHKIIEKLMDESYACEFDEIADTFNFSSTEKEQVLQMLAYSIDFRSSFMVIHTVGTVSISRALATLFKLTEKQIYEITYGAYLHDIGKVATPIEVLEKPGSLTPEEMAVMRKHVEITRIIIQPYIKPAICEIASRHHERLDKSGYPQGLGKDEMTLSERMVAVADVMSALVRRRSYKEAFDKERTLSILQKTSNAGQLCPEVVDMLIKNFDMVLDIAAQESKALSDIYFSFKEEYNNIIADIKASEAAQSI